MAATRSNAFETGAHQVVSALEGRDANQTSIEIMIEELVGAARLGHIDQICSSDIVCSKNESGDQPIRADPLKVFNRGLDGRQVEVFH